MALRAHGGPRCCRATSFCAFTTLKTLTPLTVDIDEPIVIQSSGAAGGAGAGAHEPNEGQVSMLAEMGFTHAQARKALRETVR